MMHRSDGTTLTALECTVEPEHGRLWGSVSVPDTSILNAATSGKPSLSATEGAHAHLNLDLS